MNKAIFIGTAGWSVPSRYAAECPPPGSHLERYARRLNAAEINSSFYRPHQRKTYERWAASVPAEFRFSVKVPKAMMHERGLADCGEVLNRFISEVEGLGEKLAVLLVQLPPKLAFDERIASAFFDDVRQRTKAALACEPRHAAWFTDDAARWMTERGIARVAADPAPVAGADQPGGADTLTYYRLHGSPRIYFSDYDADALATVRQKLETHCNRGAQTWCIFDNTASGAALGNALTLRAAL